MSQVHHGGLDHQELAAAGWPAERAIDFSSNCNPFGPPPAVLEALRATPGARLARYPDRQLHRLRAGLADRHGVGPDWICVGNGSAELIWALARALLGPGDRTIVLGPTFGEYAAASERCGAQVAVLDLFPPATMEMASAGAVDRAEGGKVIWLCRPNNPTGHLTGRRFHEAFLARRPATTLVVDEAYLPFVPDAEAAVPGKRVVVLRSFTKDFGMAGIRLGYLVAHPVLVERVQALLPPWNVGVLHEVAGLAALRSDGWRERTIRWLRQEGERLRAGLREQGWRLHVAEAPFFLLHAGRAARLRASLLQEGLVVRDCHSFGLSQWVRIAPQQAAANDRLVEMMGRMIDTATVAAQ